MHEERMKRIILEEAYRGITVRDGQRDVSVPIVQAVIRSLAVNAVKGQHRAQRLFAELLASVETSNKALHEEYFNAAMDYKIAWERELDRRERLGITDLPDPVPHPDHGIIDMKLGTAQIQGSSTHEEKAALERWQKRRQDYLEEVVWLEEQLATEEEPRLRQIFEEDAVRSRNLIDIIDTALSPVPKPGSTRLLGRNG
ncbi:DUF5681 domain-containing protein [Sinirhodobacter sp. WL0062]|uniref:DUF5681 domain-containing protein n=1 Tax=Rhodobacter flavimaris TaxID=2907145 RepID=A0ABS8YSY6_9RHOB|nr:DUF5681 domain-containing protein [Sinirhodobacter sp. WL0062]